MNPPIASDTDYAAALAAAASSAERSLNDARIPIHILLAAQFGELNDNQEEMLRDAAAALDSAAEELRVSRVLAGADRVASGAQREVVRIGDIVRALQPELLAQSARAGVSLIVNIAPGLPATVGAARQFRDAIRLALADDIRFALPGSTITIDIAATAEEIRITSCCGAARSASASLLLAERLLRGQGARLEHGDGETTIAVPRVTPLAAPLAAPRAEPLLPGRGPSG